jgi:DNA repair exonuclease SbcCD nuclease subunit
VKLALISDAHLFQSFVKAYDPVFDFKRVLQKIKKNNPDAILIAGDMFDYKKTTSTYLRHYEGEGLMLKIRDILNDLGIPIYAIRGNHEKEEVLKGLAQTVQNFSYIKNDWIKLGNTSIYCMDTHYEGELYEPSAVSQILKQFTSTRIKGNRILFCHESFDPFPNSLPKEAMSKTRKVFDWIINGHMHFWNPSAYNLKNVVTLPSLLPSRLRLGAYWIEQYVWKKHQKPRLRKRESPFGYAILDTDKETIAFQSYTPIKKIVEISVNVTDLSLKEALDGFRQILDEIITREDKDSLIILPEIQGLANFVASFVSEIFKEYSELNIEELRNSTTPHIVTSSGKIISAPLLDPERLFEEIEKEFETIVSELEDNTQTELSIMTLRKVLKSMQDSGLIEKMPPRITLRLENLLSEVIAQIKVEKPETFENDVKSIIKRVRE